MMKILVTLALTLVGTLSTAANFTPLKTTDVKLSILTDSQGATVYTYDRDTAGVSNCNGTCAQNWPPVAPEGDIKAPLSVVTRQDGTKQIAFKGHPLYLYVNDAGAGDISGDGVGGIWHVVHP